MQVYFWNLRKRYNSTLRPATAESPWSPEVNLKAPCDDIHPVLLMGSQESWEQVHSYNYCFFAGRYYWITNWQSVRNDLWQASCELDVLATYREDILKTSAYVEYDTSGNTWIVDHRLSKLETATARGNGANLNIDIIAGGSYILCVTGSEGSVQYYALSKNALANLLNSVLDWATINTEDYENKTEELVVTIKAFARNFLSSGSAPQNIRGCMWVPFLVAGESETIYLGAFNTGQAGRRIDNPVKSVFMNIDVPWQASDWRRSALFHNFELTLPYCGVVGLDAGVLAGADYITVEAGVDYRTGDMTYRISASNGNDLGIYSGSCGVGIPIGIASYSPTAITGSIFNAFAQISTGNYALAALSSAGAASNVLCPNITAVGTATNGSVSGLLNSERVSLVSLFHNTNVTPASVSAVMGTPTMAVKTLSGLHGYVKTRGASVSANAGSNTITKINGMLDSGIFIE